MHCADEHRLNEDGIRFWAGAKEWRLHDAGCLIAGLDPSKVASRRVSSHENPDDWAHVRLAELLRQELGAYDYQKPFPVVEILAAADLLEMRIPKRLQDEVERFARRRDAAVAVPSDDQALLGLSGESIDKRSVATSFPEDELAGPGLRRMQTCLKIIAAVAYDAYGWRPSVRGSTAKEIESATQRIGSSISDDTIRSVLQDAAEFVDIESGAE